MENLLLLLLLLLPNVPNVIIISGNLIFPPSHPSFVRLVDSRRKLGMPLFRFLCLFQSLYATIKSTLSIQLSCHIYLFHDHHSPVYRWRRGRVKQDLAGEVNSWMGKVSQLFIQPWVHCAWHGNLCRESKPAPQDDEVGTPTSNLSHPFISTPTQGGWRIILGYPLQGNKRRTGYANNGYSARKLPYSGTDFTPLNRNNEQANHLSGVCPDRSKLGIQIDL